jgi:phosphoribosylformylglycinamidine synthase PurS subunit
MRAKVTVYPRREILDPQGKAISDALRRVGFGQVSDVRAGKSFEIELEAASAGEAEQALRQMCQKLLVNPVVEDFTVEVLEPTGVAAS